MRYQELVDLWRRASSRGEPVYMATVVHVEGSSYRKQGARMVVTGSGERAGTISGGCLEAEVVRKIAWLTKDGPTIRSYRSSFDDEDSNLPYGLGCGGTVWLLMESGIFADAVLRSMESALYGQTSVAVYQLAGDCIRGEIWKEEDANLAASAYAEIVRDSLTTGRFAAASIEAGSVLPSFVCIPSIPPPRLWVFGAGDDAQPVVRMAAELGWQVTVADGRANLLRKDRFKSASRLHLLRYTGNLDAGSFNELAEELPINENDLVVVLTHSYLQDRAILRAMQTCRPRYLGVLGPRDRTRRLVESIVGLDEAEIQRCFANMRSPVGLAIGGEDPSVIALAIVTEIQAELAGKVVSVASSQTTHTTQQRQHVSWQR